MDNQIIYQNQRKIYSKIELLNHNFQRVDEISGNVISQDFSINSSSDIRRTCSIQIQPTDDSYSIKQDGKIWLDKYLKIFIGVENIRSGVIEYYNQGIFLINNPSQSYDAVSNTISIQGIDLVSKLNGVRYGILTDANYVIPQGSNIRNVIIQLLKDNNFNNYIVEECPIKTPYQITVSKGGTVWDILKQLRDILPQYEMFFDVDGVFHYQLIPSGDNEQILINDDIWSDYLINWEKSTDFERLKNSIIVYGELHRINHYGNEVSSINNIYSMTIPSITTLYDYLKVGFIPKTSGVNPFININNLGNFPLKTEDGNDAILEVDKYAVIRWSAENNMYIYLGGLQAKGIAKDTDVDSPFNINNPIGEIKIALNGGEYDNIYSDELAEQRAKYELYKRCRLLDGVRITTLPIYDLDVNKVIELTLPNNQQIEKTEKYIIKGISTSDTQSVQLMKYYPFYPNN